tara:strand:- start:331 stop:1044 length:714 start_codon:yes stop_codon:yes gene_type:complete
MTVFCNIYSTFLQRAYDQVIHDVALQNLPVIFCLDRAGLVGEDGATHHGVFDLAYLNCIPNLIIFAPLNEAELRNILYTAQLGLPHPIAIRYPRGRAEGADWQKPFEFIEINRVIQLKQGNDTAVFSTSTIGNNVIKALAGFDNTIAHYHFGFVKPLNEDVLHTIFKQYIKIITIEDGTVTGGFGSSVASFAAKNGYQQKISILGVPDKFIEHGTVAELQQCCGIDVKSLKEIFSAY